MQLPCLAPREPVLPSWTLQKRDCKPLQRASGASSTCSSDRMNLRHRRLVHETTLSWPNRRGYQPEAEWLSSRIETRCACEPVALPSPPTRRKTCHFALAWPDLSSLLSLVPLHAHCFSVDAETSFVLQPTVVPDLFLPSPLLSCWLYHRRTRHTNSNDETILNPS